MFLMYYKKVENIKLTAYIELKVNPWEVFIKKTHISIYGQLSSWCCWLQMLKYFTYLSLNLNLQEKKQASDIAQFYLRMLYSLSADNDVYPIN